MISREILKQVILDQKSLQADMSVPREALLQVKTWAENKLIVIITGLRRCGKSTLIKQNRELCHERDFNLNFEDERLISFQVEDFQTLLELFIEQFGDQKIVYFD